MSKKILRIAAPIALSLLAPGIGTALGITSAAGTTALGAGLGAAGGAIGGGGLKGALLGAATGGLGGYASTPGAFGGALGQGAHTLPAGISGPVSAGSGIKGALGIGATNGLGAAGGGASSFGSTIANLGSNLGSSIASNDALAQQEEAQKKGLAALKPYAESGLAANEQLGNLLGIGSGADQASITEALRNTPGYQFNLEQGTQALDRSAAARGGLFSGAAAKQLQEYGQGLADNTYQSAIANLRPSVATGAGAASGQVGLYDNIGALQANNTANQSNLLNNSLSTIFGSNDQDQMVLDPKTGKYVKKSQLGVA
jgi:hypothetical protein